MRRFLRSIIVLGGVGLLMSSIVNETMADIAIPTVSHVSFATAVPEATTLFLMGTGLVSIAAFMRRKLKARKPYRKPELSSPGKSVL